MPDRMTSLPRHVSDASASQTGPSQAEPVPVSALRASVPSAVTVITLRDVIKHVPKAWEAAYAVGYYAKDHDKQVIAKKLRALDVETCSADDVAEIIGNRSWVENDCDLCGGKECEIILQIGDEPSYDARWMNACLPCAASLGSLAAQAMSDGSSA